MIEPRVLARVPLRTADLHGVFPVLYDDKAGALSVVTADPDNDAALHEVKLTAQVREVRALAARPASVRAAIAYHYRGDRAAFQALLRPAAGFELSSSDPFERRDARDGRDTRDSRADERPAAGSVAAPAAASIGDERHERDPAEYASTAESDGLAAGAARLGPAWLAAGASGLATSAAWLADGSTADAASDAANAGVGVP